MSETSDCCGTCRYFNPESDRSAPFTIQDGEQVWSRECRRFPTYAYRHPSHWCGEFTRKEG